jgi:hypothetical protein
VSLPLKGLIETFGDQTPLLTSLILIERRPVLFVGYVESEVLRELRQLTPHRDVYEIGRNIPTRPKDADQFILDMLQQEDALASQSSLRRSLVLAPNVEGGVISTLLHFKKAWVASSMTIPQQDQIRASNVAIYDVNGNKWLNIDRSRIDTAWSANLIREAETKKNDDLIQAFLNYAITYISNKASALCNYISGGTTSQDEIWRDIGEPSDEERKVITSLCRAEFNTDVAQVFQRSISSIKSISKPLNEIHGAQDIDRSSTVGKLVVRLAAEERRMKECLDTIRSRLQ